MKYTEQMIVPVDVDKTLIVPLNMKVKPGTLPIEIQDPYDGELTYRYPHYPNIKLLKNYHAQGAFIWVWSKNGAQWAKAVIERLGLEDHCSFVSRKPFIYIDDMPVETWFGFREYLSPMDDFGQEPLQGDEE